MKKIGWFLGIAILLVIIAIPVLDKIVGFDRPPVQDYNEAIQQQNSKLAHEKITIGNYQEHVVTLPGTTIPVGLDVGFDVTQAAADYRLVTLYLGVKENERSISLMDCLGANPADPHYIAYHYLLNSAGKTDTHFHCMPLFVWLNDEAWLHGEKRDHICFRPNLLKEMLVGNLKEYKDYRQPTANIGVMLGFNRSFFNNKADTQNTPVITDMLKQSMPANAQLQNEAFWRGIINQSLQPETLAKAGYKKCYHTDNMGDGGWLLECYCRN